MMVYSQLYRSVGSTPRAMQTGKRHHKFRSHIFHLSIMMSLYSKQNCNNNRDDE